MEIQIKTGWLSAVDCQYICVPLHLESRLQMSISYWQMQLVRQDLFSQNENAQPLKRKFLPNGWGRWNTPDMEMAAHGIYTSASSSLLALYYNHRVYM